MKMKLTELTFDKIAEWPKCIKIFAIAFVCMLLLILGYYFDFKNQNRSLDKNKKQELILKQQLTVKFNHLDQLKQLEAQANGANKLFDELLIQLTKNYNVPQLLAEISQISNNNDLHLQTIKVLPEKESDLYTKVPIKIIADGDYHQLVNFINALANMQRIITFKSLIITKPKETNKLNMIVITEFYQPVADMGKRNDAA